MGWVSDAMAVKRESNRGQIGNLQIAQGLVEVLPHKAQCRESGRQRTNFHLLVNIYW